MNKNTKIKIYFVTVERSITTEHLLLLAYTLGQLDMLIKEHYKETAYEVTHITLQEQFDKVITPQLL